MIRDRLTLGMPLGSPQLERVNLGEWAVSEVVNRLGEKRWGLSPQQVGSISTACWLQIEGLPLWKGLWPKD